MCPTLLSLCEGLSAAPGDPIEPCDDVGEWIFWDNGSVMGLLELLNVLNNCKETRYTMCRKMSL